MGVAYLNRQVSVWQTREHHPVFGLRISLCSAQGEILIQLAIFACSRLKDERASVRTHSLYANYRVGSAYAWWDCCRPAPLAERTMTVMKYKPASIKNELTFRGAWLRWRLAIYQAMDITVFRRRSMCLWSTVARWKEFPLLRTQR